MLVVWRGVRWQVTGVKTYRGRLYYMLTDRGVDHGWVCEEECVRYNDP